MKEFNDLMLDYREVAYLMDITVKESKHWFQEALIIDKVKLDDLLSVEDLRSCFGVTRSYDPRYDKVSKITFYLEQKALNYKKHLSDESNIKKAKFTGSHSIFYKILSEDQVKHATEQLEYKHRYKFGQESLDKLVTNQ